MARVALVMPVLGVEQPTGRIAGWLKHVGDEVARGEAVAEIETEKVTVEMQSTASGRLVEILAPAGTEVAVGDPIGWLEDSA